MYTFSRPDYIQAITFLFLRAVPKGTVHQKQQLQNTSEALFLLSFHPADGTLPAHILAEQDFPMEGGKASLTAQAPLAFLIVVIIPAPGYIFGNIFSFSFKI